MNRTARLLLLKNECRYGFTSPTCLPGITGTAVVIVVVFVVVVVVVVVLLVAFRE
jgi:hypothetical protein